MTSCSNIPKTKIPIPIPQPDNKLWPALISLLIASVSKLEDSVESFSNAVDELLRKSSSLYYGIGVFC